MRFSSLADGIPRARLYNEEGAMKNGPGWLGPRCQLSVRRVSRTDTHVASCRSGGPKPCSAGEWLPLFEAIKGIAIKRGNTKPPPAVC